MDDDITTEDVIDETGAAEAPVDVPEVADVDPDSVEPEAPPLYAGKYRSIEEWERGHAEAERWGHEQAQRAAEYERQLQQYQAQLAQQSQPAGYVDPFAQLPGAQLPEYQQEEIAASAQANPKGTALWAHENRESLPPQVVSQLMAYWQSNDFYGHQEWQFSEWWKQQSGQFEERLHEQYQPLVDQSQKTINTGTIEAAKQRIPNWEAWAPHIVAYLEQNPTELAQLQAVALQPDQAVAQLERVYAWVAYQARRSGTPIVKAAATSTQTPVGETVTGAQTVTGDTGDAPDVAVEEDEHTASLRRGLKVLGRGR